MGSRLLCSCVVLLVVAGWAGCGGGSSRFTSEPTPASAERPVTVKLDTGAGGENDASGVAPPDGGLEQGHGADVILQAQGSTASVSGRVEPADSTVRVIGPRGATVARSLGKGRFEARVTGLRLGLNYVRVLALSANRKTWSRKIRIVRR